MDAAHWQVTTPWGSSALHWLFANVAQDTKASLSLSPVSQKMAGFCEMLVFHKEDRHIPRLNYSVHAGPRPLCLPDLPASSSCPRVGHDNVELAQSLPGGASALLGSTYPALYSTDKHQSCGLIYVSVSFFVVMMRDITHRETWVMFGKEFRPSWLQGMCCTTEVHPCPWFKFYMRHVKWEYI